MRGTDRQTAQPFGYLSPENLVPPDHPLSASRQLVNAGLDRLLPTFVAVYADGG